MNEFQNKLKFMVAHQSIDKSDITSFEKSIGYILPTDYKLFLEGTNGGKLEEGQVIDYEDERLGSLEVMLDTMYGINGAGFELGLSSLSADPRRRSGILPKHILSIIGCYDGHMEIVMSLLPAEHGHIFLWDNQAIFSYTNVYPVAQSFSEFLSLVHKMNYNKSLEILRKIRMSLKEQRSRESDSD